MGVCPGCLCWSINFGIQHLNKRVVGQILSIVLASPTVVQMVSVMVVHMVMIDVVWVVMREMNHLVVDYFGLDQFEDGNRSSQHERQQAQCERLPRLQSNQSHGQRHQHGSLELQTDQERDDDLLNDAASCNFNYPRVVNKKDPQNWKIIVTHPPQQVQRLGGSRFHFRTPVLRRGMSVPPVSGTSGERPFLKSETPRSS